MVQSSEDRDRARLLFYVGLSGGVLCLLTVLATVIIRGTIDPTVGFLLLAWAGIAFGLIPVSVFAAGRNRDE